MKDEVATEENLRVEEGEVDLRQRTKTFALRVVRLFVGLEKSVEAQVLGKQLLRSGTSVGANYREAFRARSKPEFISKLGDCLKELDESSYWLELLVDSGMVATAKVSALQDECNQLTAIFTSIAKRAKANVMGKL